MNIIYSRYALILIFLFSGCADKSKVNESENKGQTTTNQLKDSNSEPFKTYPGLEKKDELYYGSGENDPFTGTTESNYDNGVPFVQANFKNGKLHGTYTAYYRNEQKMGVSNYLEGLKHGESVAWHENGEKASEVTFNNGKEEGILKVYYPNGQQRLEAQFKEGVRVGQTIQWDSTGTILNNTSDTD